MDTRQSGFTVVELMAVMVIGAVLLTLGAFELRDYTRAKALTAARDQTVTQLRNAQQRTFAEGYPRSYGIRFLEGKSSWDVVRWDAVALTCTVVESHSLTNGVTISAAETDFPESPAVTACRNAAPVQPGSYEVALFYARGTSTAGSVTFLLEQTGSKRTVSIDAATGRVS